MKQSRILGAALLAVTVSTGHAQPAPAPPPPPAPAESRDADLAKAGDATAAAAATPVAGAPTSAAADNAADLDALGLDPALGGGFDDKLNIYGFADFSWWRVSGAFVKPQSEFYFGKLNVYFAKAFTPRWRSLAEVRLMFAPNGNGGGAFGFSVPETTTVADTTDFNRSLQWGGIAIRRAYIEYDVDTHVTIRAGHWLTPYGIWNTDHGSPVIISPYAPHIIGENLFPEAQTGLQAYGSVLLGDYSIGYYATLSNGRSAVEATQDVDHRVALGGRFEFEAPWAGTFKAGVSAYGGRSTEITSAAPAPGPGPATALPAEWAYNERDYSADAQWDHGGLHVQAEYIHHNRDPIGGLVQGAPGELMINTNQGTNWGFYALAGYRFDRLWRVMPFAFYADWHPLGGMLTIREVNVGVNFRPTPSVVLKAMTSTVWTIGVPIDPLKLFSTQIAWVF